MGDRHPSGWSYTSRVQSRSYCSPRLTQSPLLQVLQHAWTYRPMVHDVLGMSLNRISLASDPPGGAAAALGGAKAAPKAVEVGEGDFFWELNCNQPFPKVAADVDVQLGKYKEVRVWGLGSRVQGASMALDPDKKPYSYGLEVETEEQSFVLWLPVKAPLVVYIHI